MFSPSLTALGPTPSALPSPAAIGASEALSRRRTPTLAVAELVKFNLRKSGVHKWSCSKGLLDPFCFVPNGKGKCRSVFVVGGHISHGNSDKGNVFTIPSNKYAEFNMFLDPLAAKIMIELQCNGMNCGKGSFRPNIPDKPVMCFDVVLSLELHDVPNPLIHSKLDKGLNDIANRLIVILAVGDTKSADGELVNVAKLDMFVDKLPGMPKIYGFEMKNGVHVSKSLEIGMFMKRWLGPLPSLRVDVVSAGGGAALPSLPVQPPPLVATVRCRVGNQGFRKTSDRASTSTQGYVTKYFKNNILFREFFLGKAFQVAGKGVCIIFMSVILSFQALDGAFNVFCNENVDTINLSEFLTYIALVGILNNIQQSKAIKKGNQVREEVRLQTTAIYREDNMELLYVLHGQEGGITHIHVVAVQFSRDGNYLYTGSRRVGFVDKLQRRRQELTQTTPDQPVDDEAVYYKVAGDCPKGCVYDLVSLWRKKRRYVDPDASTSCAS
ncbi:hypothetical protein Scep_021435 [Stephania cephalantha]|uniref:Uncharacterized protein n=1 Tax=Stephania cephalantha TaxID=152367 RepID=A0AAP0F4L0_9MAGN